MLQFNRNCRMATQRYFHYGEHIIKMSRLAYVIKIKLVES